MHRAASGAEGRAHDEDSTWIAACARGDRDGLGRLYDRYAPVLLGIGVRLLGVRREAEDLVHDVFLEAWRQARDYDRSRGTVRTWLIVRMRSRCLDRMKSAGFARAVPLEDRSGRESALDAPAPVGEDFSGADQSAVRRALASLSDDQRRVIELGYYEGLSSTEISARLGIPVGTVKSRVAAAFTRLRAELAETRPAQDGN